MIHPAKLTALALLSLTTLPVLADQTNLVQTVSIQLAGYRQGATSTNGPVVTTRVELVQLGTRDVLSALAAATGNTFSRTARLVFSTPIQGGASVVQVRDGANNVDVTSFFTLAQVGNGVTEAQGNTHTGRWTSTTMNAQRFGLVDAAGFPALRAHFDVGGIASETVVSNGGRLVSDQLNADVSGAGDLNGASLVLRGGVSVSGTTLEVISSGGFNF